MSYNNQPYPTWAEIIGWVLAFMSMSFIPVFAVIQFYKAKGATLAEVNNVWLNIFIQKYMYELLYGSKIMQILNYGEMNE